MDLMLPGGHLITFFKTGHIDLFHTTQAQGREGNINGHIPTTDHNHPPAQFDLLTEADISEEVDPERNPIQIFTLNPGPVPRGSAGCYKDGLKSFFHERFIGYIFSKGDICPRFNADGEHPFNLPVKNLLWETVFWDPVIEGSTKFGKAFEDGGGVP